MFVSGTIKEARAYLQKQKKAGKSVGFVPTMGALHEGHLSLLRCARSENDVTVVSIFVNPIQFNNPADLVKYPRDLHRDLDSLEKEQCDLVFTPSVSEMYPEPETREYDFGDLTRVMEGKCRPGHFNGVSVVVQKLFGIIQPGRAYFGEKDFQQLAVIRRLVEMENIPVEIVACPTKRDPDGLAMSSRNQRLSHAQRKTAPILYQVLKKARSEYGDIPLHSITTKAIKTLNNQPEMQVEYFTVVDASTLQPLTEHQKVSGIRICVAATLGSVRLIDNIPAG